jgi:PhnB protein
MPGPSRITAYLTFNGNCREAMRFYKKCFGGELLVQVMEQSPLGKTMPAKMKKVILHAELKVGEFTIYASDILPEEGKQEGNNIMLALKCSNKKQVDLLFKKLSPDIKAARNFTGNGSMTEVKDKYGNCWLLYCGNS